MKCFRCGTDYNGNFCPNCGTPAHQNIQRPIQTNMASNVNVQSVRTPIYKKRFFWIIIGAIIFVSALGRALGLYEEEDISDSSRPLSSQLTQSSVSSAEEKEEPTESVVEEKNYETKITWAALNNYCCAVEIDSYDGDKLQAGTYRFYPDFVSGLENGRVAIVWDIYVSENLYNQLSDLKDSEYKGTVGGISKNEIELDLSKGEYVYVKYNPVANNDPTGVLIIEKK